MSWFKCSVPSMALRKELRRIIVQGNGVAIQKLFDALYRAAGQEFLQDNKATLDAYLAERMARASATYWEHVEEGTLNVRD